MKNSKNRQIFNSLKVYWTIRIMACILKTKTEILSLLCYIEIMNYITFNL